ncbi:MAG: glycosyltransferase, partial [Verrucomicrobia bacterium]|nr:glycosyltransferase [Verrucomicrobiota bacterium]
VELLRHSKLVLVFSDRAAAILFERYASDPRRVRVIPHGVPDVPFRLPDDADYPGLPSRKMRFITAGLIRPAKGIEHALAALKTLKKSFSDFTYVIAGADHPKSSAAAQYRQTLLTLITEYGLENHVVLVDRFLDAREMHNLIQACHAGILPYAAPDQSSSGVLALLLACGRPVIASDFQYSRAILNDRIGAVVPALDTKAAG